MFAWDPQQYTRFADDRARPFHDLLARVGAAAPRRVLDLGCGDGTLTATLAIRWPTAAVTGIDSSPEMLARAAAVASERVGFRSGDVGALDPDPDADVVISNAVLQWVPEHADVLRRWARTLRPGAWLAFQVPGNFGSASHTVMRDLAASAPWADRLDGVLRHGTAVHSPAEYARLLRAEGWTVDAWETTYVHVLAGPDPVLQWVRGTGLRPVLAALSAPEGARFEADLADRLRRAYPGAQDATTLFPFRRIFCVAQHGRGELSTA